MICYYLIINFLRSDQGSFVARNERPLTLWVVISSPSLPLIVYQTRTAQIYFDVLQNTLYHLRDFVILSHCTTHCSINQGQMDSDLVFLDSNYNSWESNGQCINDGLYTWLLGVLSKWRLDHPSNLGYKIFALPDEICNICWIGWSQMSNWHENDQGCYDVPKSNY